MRKFAARASLAISGMVPHRLKGAHGIKRMVSSFAEQSNMVYFGYVSQLSDEHRIVRGLTVSTRHRDDHYCIGTHEDYDVVFVERTDTILTKHTHTWHIMEFDLKTTHDIPHIFIGSSRHGFGFHSLLKTKYSMMTPAVLGATAQYPTDFTQFFGVYTSPEYAVQAEYFIDPHTAGLIAKHCKGLVIEVTQDALYVYSEKVHLSVPLLDAMLANGVWLAKLIDQKSQL